MLRNVLCFVFIATIHIALTVTAATTTNASSGGCGCSYDKIWIDIMLVIDSSFVMTKKGFETLTDFIRSTVGKMSIGQEEKQVSRIGAITYAHRATVVYNLTTFQSMDDMYNNFDPPYYGTSGSNIEEAIRLANAAFTTTNNRPNAKKVIIIAASHYRPETSNDPMQIAETFKRNGGMIVTIEYVQVHGLKVSLLNELATSPCYQLTNKYGELQPNHLLDVLCKANCFCKTHWYAFVNDTKCGTPVGGCFYPVSISSSAYLATRFCEKNMEGMLPKITDINKAMFLASLTPHHQRTWLGLTGNGKSHNWRDGISVGDFKPFIDVDHSKNCTIQQQISERQVGWYSADCKEDHVYSCEMTPCNTDKYCP